MARVLYWEICPPVFVIEATQTEKGRIRVGSECPPCYVEWCRLDPLDTHGDTHAAADAEGR